MKVRNVIRMLQTDGWVLVRQRGSHRQFRHPNKQGLTISGARQNDMGRGMLNSVLKQAGLKP